MESLVLSVMTCFCELRPVECYLSCERQHRLLQSRNSNQCSEVRALALSVQAHRDELHDS